MLGTLCDADDVVQETFARLTRHGMVGIDDVLGWLVTTAGRICLDRLRSDAIRRRYVGPWLPEPFVELPGREIDPADRVTLDDNVRLALLVVLETLTPAERTVFVLHDAFGLDFDRIAAVVGRTSGACRQLASRARRKVRADPEARAAVVVRAGRVVAERFAAACATGELHALLEVLDPDVTGEFDSGGAIPGAPLVAVVGAPAVAMSLYVAFANAGATFRVLDVNGQPGVSVELHDLVVAVIGLVTDGHHVLVIHAVGNPAKLARLNRT